MTAKIIDFKSHQDRKINQEIEDQLDVLFEGDDGMSGVTLVANFEELEGVKIILHFDNLEEEEENGRST